MVTIIKYKKITIYHSIYIKVFSDGTVSYPTVSATYVLNITNNYTAFTELRRIFEEYFEIKLEEGYVLKYLNFRICQSPIVFSVDQTYHIMVLVNDWFPAEKIRRVDTTFRTDATYEKELLAAFTLTGNALQKSEMGYHGKLGHTMERIQHIFLMSRIGIVTQPVV